MGDVSLNARIILSFVFNGVCSWSYICLVSSILLQHMYCNSTSAVIADYFGKQRWLQMSRKGCSLSCSYALICLNLQSLITCLYCAANKAVNDHICSCSHE